MTLNKIAIWRNDDGTIKITKFVKSAQILSKLSENDFINLQITRLKNEFNFGDKQVFVINDQDFESFIKQVENKDHDKIVIDNAGNLSVNNLIKTESEIRQESVNSIKQKLIIGEKLTANEADFLIK